VGGSSVTTPAGKDPVKNPDGGVTLPGGGAVQEPNGVRVEVPGGTAVDKDGNITIPDGGRGTVKTPGGVEISIPGGSAVTDDGKTITVGVGGGKITYPGGGSVDVPGGAVIEILDPNVPLGGLKIIDPGAGADIPFTDVKPSDWFADDVLWAYENNLFKGTSETEFSPGASMTRGMIVTVLHRLAGEPGAGGAAQFTDVPGGAWYAGATAWAQTGGIVSGVGRNLFSPNGNVTRQDLAVILYRYEQLTGEAPAGAAAVGEFADGDHIADYAKSAVNALAAQGILNGKPGKLFDPAAGATRAEVAAVLHRFAVNAPNQ
jgi:hypothetical protein